MVAELLGDDWTSAIAVTVPEVSLLPGLFPLHLPVLLSGLFALHLAVLLPLRTSATVGLQRQACFGWADWTVAGMSKQNLTHHPGLEPEQHKQLLSAGLVIQTTQGRCEGQVQRAGAEARCKEQMQRAGAQSSRLSVRLCIACITHVSCKHTQVCSIVSTQVEGSFDSRLLDMSRGYETPKGGCAKQTWRR